MSRTLSTGMGSAVDATITTPGYLLEIEFSTPTRLCTRGDLTVLGNDWTGWGFSLSGFGIDATSAKQTGTISISNRDNDISTLILEEGISDRAVRIWKFYTDAPSDDDPVLIFDGVGAQSDIDTASGQIKITLRQARDAVQFAPAHYITAEQGFSMLPPAGTIITVGSTSFILEPESF